MSTQFTSRTTGEWSFTRWCGPGSSESPKRSTFDFGRDPSRVFSVKESFERGEVFDGDDGSTFTEWEQVESGVWTFGDFGGTFEVGSGDVSTWEGM